MRNGSCKYSNIQQFLRTRNHLSGFPPPGENPMIKEERMEESEEMKNDVFGTRHGVFINLPHGQVTSTTSAAGSGFREIGDF